MLTQQNNRYTLGVGLIPDSQLTEFIEELILSYLDINTILICAKIDKIWSRRMTEEIKHRERCVTIYTWLEEEKSSVDPNLIRNEGGDKILTTDGNFGHSALRTWNGGKNDKGHYISFYPGNRSCKICHKETSHFHTWNQDNSEEKDEKGRDKKKKPIAIDLYGLNVEAINETFSNLHDSQRNSRKGWSPRFNCSDLTLLLLEKGELFEKIDFNPFDSLTVITISVIYSILMRAFFEYLFRMKNLYSVIRSKETTRLLEGQRAQGIKILTDHPHATSQEKVALFKKLNNPSSKVFSNFRNLLNEAQKKDLALSVFLPPLMRKCIYFFGKQSRPFFLKSYPIMARAINGIINVPVTSLIIYIFYYHILSKKYNSKRTKKVARSNAIKSAIFLAIEPTVSYGVFSFLMSLGFKDLARAAISGPNFFLLNLLGISSFNQLFVITGLSLHYDFVIKSLNPGLSYDNPIDGSINYKNPTLKNWFFSLMLISYPFILTSGFFLLGRYFYDTTATPKYVLNVSKKAKKKLDGYGDKSKKDISRCPSLTISNLWKHKNKILVSAAGIALIGLFAVKKKQDVFAISNQNNARNQFKL